MFTREQNQLFDEILESRRSCRNFTDRLPDRDDIAAIIKAGQLSPYASLSARDVAPFRHFFVLYRDNPLLAQIDALIRAQSGADADNLRREMEEDPFLREYGAGIEKLWDNVAKPGPKIFSNPPCLIVMAEWRGARRAEKQSMAHMAQNMWLKATALNLGFVLVSALESMTDNQAFCDLFGLPAGRYGFHGCIVGYRAEENLTSPSATTEVHWL